MVKLAEENGVDLSELSLAQMREVEPRMTESVFAVLGIDNSVKSRVSYGGTAPDQVREQARLWKERLS